MDFIIIPVILQPADKINYSLNAEFIFSILYSFRFHNSAIIAESDPLELNFLLLCIPRSSNSHIFLTTETIYEAGIYCKAYLITGKSLPDWIWLSGLNYLYLDCRMSWMQSKKLCCFSSYTVFVNYWAFSSECNKRKINEKWRSAHTCHVNNVAVVALSLETLLAFRLCESLLRMTMA